MTQASISVVIPTAGAPSVFSECLASIFANSVQPLEVLLIDDCMDEAAYRIASNFNVKIVKNFSRGVSAARNNGAHAAIGEIILFMDTDVILPVNAIELIQNSIESENLDGVIGVQKKNLRLHDFFSRYKNHWMRYTYRRLEGHVHLFYTSCAAIRKKVFLKAGGFDENYRKPDIEDTVFGSNLGKVDARIHVANDLEIEHVKQYDLMGILSTDLKRSASLMRYILRNWREGKRGGIRRTSVPKRFMGGVLLMCLVYMAFLSVFLVGFEGLTYAGIALLFLILLNSSWLLYLSREENLGFALKSIGFLPIDMTWVIFGIIAGASGFIAGHDY